MYKAEDIRKGQNMDNQKKPKKRGILKWAVDTRFAVKVLVVIGITTAIFIVMNYVSFVITGMEQTTLIEKYFDAVVIECGALMLKRISEVIVARVRKKEKLDITDEESEE